MKRSPFSVAIIAVLASAVACKGSEPPPAPSSSGPQASGPQTSQTQAQVPPTTPGGTPTTPGDHPALERAPSRCPANKAVSNDDLAQVGGALFHAYRAALKGNTADAFNDFLAAFHPDADRNHLKTQIFPRVVEHVGKYVAGPSDPTFTLCRIEQQSPERVKVFVQSRDARKSDPPVILVLHEGKWLIDAMTP